MKNFLFVGVIALLPQTLGCFKPAETPPVGIIGALPQEVEAVRKLMANGTEEKVNNKTVYRGTIQNFPVVLVESGMGKVNAAATTQLLVTKFGAKEIVFSGVAGGVRETSEVGDVVIAERLAQHDYGLVTPGGKASWRPGTLSFEPVAMSTLWYSFGQSPLYKTLLQAVPTVDLGKVPAELRKGDEKPTVRSGVVVTGDEFIASEEKRKWLETVFGADAVEMEGAAFAQVCENNRIDCAVIRTISDLANENSHVDFPRFASYAAQNSAKLIEALFKAKAGQGKNP